mmetsp:Transcript_24061/g.32272  ORF Transcript_24061/g.32272 Transcript_24061/m.32272 type:complete len:138 (+) Transcript_24061:953-1366(+)|eukprot:CAMPEP_0185616546 /NCGR_PEP_ID=MMETSP0436-20130131/40161_1 /TAXON_ID=626734 ORGANISM="Favella taraikaensis, Strain Fe Narragansett Bay" /NCGR_SAMPLE_ID=MMETSP0436 /ASSEMBLY_ACC=CAM_ASM_000390 /LENGTH=137 /DNA_ID=CAMNT_0028253327 /DNA_START=370 /DNA_END=780 /DNA_ORIENTATION=+
MTALKGVILRQAMGRIQSGRSFNENLIAKKDIWDTKNFFRNKVGTYIAEENFKHTSMMDLERSVIKRVKDAVIADEIKPAQLDGPWKAWNLRRIHTNAFTTLRRTMMSLILSRPREKRPKWIKRPTTASSCQSEEIY